MGIFYLLHEYTERYHTKYPLGKKFARTIILGFIVYYAIYFLLPLYFTGYAARIQHFTKYLIVVDILSSSIFYGGLLNSLSFWSTGKQMLDECVEPEQSFRTTCQSVRPQMKLMNSMNLESAKEELLDAMNSDVSDPDVSDPDVSDPDVSDPDE